MFAERAGGFYSSTVDSGQWNGMVVERGRGRAWPDTDSQTQDSGAGGCGACRGPVWPCMALYGPVSAAGLGSDMASTVSDDGHDGETEA